MPKAAIDANLATIPGLDGQKMSKSYNNAINIFISKEELKKRVMAIVTDAKGVDEVKDPTTCNLFAIYRLFLSEEAEAELTARYLKPGLKYGDTKKELIETIWNYFAPYREVRADLAKRPDYVRDVMRAGAQKARATARPTMDAVWSKVGLKY
jgi:tryptophanyl-tRNA synthetase